MLGGSAYGFNWAGDLVAPREVRSHLGPPGPFPSIELRTIPLHDRPTVRLAGENGGLALHREAGAAVMTAPVPPEEVTHPLVSYVAAVFAAWEGAAALHAGAFAVDGSAWVVLGGKGAGKTTALALLAREGVDILADDLAVIRRGRVASGPRHLDLRRDVAHVAEGSRTEDVRGGRVRMKLPPAPAGVPLGGLIELTPGPATYYEPIGRSEALATIRRHHAFAELLGEPATYLDLLAVPALRVTRATALEATDLLSAVAAHG